MGMSILEKRQIDVMHSYKAKMAIQCATATRNYLTAKYGGNLSGKCKEAADLMIESLRANNVRASKHFGWCLYDNCDNCTGEPCAPHCYVLVHDGNRRLYLDCTATQFQFGLDRKIPEIILLEPGKRPYWFREKKPSIKEMEDYSGY